MHLENGHYQKDPTVEVVHWPEPDANGNGEQVFEEKFDNNGNFMGRQEAKDAQGRPIFRYNPPEGFVNVRTRDPGSDGQTENYVKATPRGQVWRHPETGHAVGIREGQSLVFYPNGDNELLKDDFARYRFLQSHRPVEAPADKPDVEKPLTDEEKAREEEERDREEYEAWRKERNAKKDDTA